MGAFRIVLLSGPFKVGKSTITTELVENHGFKKISSSAYLKQLTPEVRLLSEAESRPLLQRKGDELDVTTDYLWVVEPVTTTAIADSPNHTKWLFDAVRKKRQVEHFRCFFGAAVAHVHLTAPEATLFKRSQLSKHDYARDTRHPNEISSRSMIEIADLVLNTSELGPQQIANIIAS